jgi:hypothetical protein
MNAVCGGSVGSETVAASATSTWCCQDGGGYVTSTSGGWDGSASAS